MRRHGRTRRPAYAVTFAMMGLALLATTAFLLAHFAMLDMARERQAVLESVAQQMFESARAWSLAHAAELPAAPAESPAGGTPTERDHTRVVVLPMDGLLPAGATGSVALRRVAAADGAALIACRLTLDRAGRTLRREAHWPLPADGTTRPAPSAATP